MKFLILHGSFGSPDENWFPWLKTQLLDLQQDVLIPQFPVENYKQVNDIASKGKLFEPQNQTLKNWIDTFEQEVIPWISNQEVCIVAHSLSPAFVLSAVKKFSLSLDSAIFVAPFMEDLGNPIFDMVNRQFYQNGFDFMGVQELIPVSYTLYSSNDPYVPTAASLKFAEKINSTPIPVRNADHMGGMLKEFPLVLELCRTRIGLL